MDIKRKIVGFRKLFRPDSDVLVNVKPFVKKLSSPLTGLGVEVMLGGSVAKGTFLPGKYDVDIFVRFPLEYSGKDISGILKKALDKLKLKYDVLHGSRDYFQVDDNIIYEVVPVLKVRNPGDAENVADMSPLHVAYFNRKATNAIREDVRLLKAFLKANSLYGAESYIKGFSGHVVDLLILYYGSFHELLRKAVNWKEKTVIDLEKHYSVREALIFLNESKIQGPLILVDPVQKNRNAAAALSLESFNVFKSLAKAFLKNPSTEFFREKPFKEKILLAKEACGQAKHFLVEIKPLKVKEDVAGAKALKIREYLEKQLEEHGFKILGAEWDFSLQATKIFLSVSRKSLPAKRLIIGPPAEMAGHVAAFKKKHGKTFNRQGRVCAEEKRKHTTPDSLLKELLKTTYVREKCRGASLGAA